MSPVVQKRNSIAIGIEIRFEKEGKGMGDCEATLLSGVKKSAGSEKRRIRKETGASAIGVRSEAR